MWAGGATALAEAGTPPNFIQTAGRWTTDTFNRSYLKLSFLANLLSILSGLKFSLPELLLSDILFFFLLNLVLLLSDISFPFDIQTFNIFYFFPLSRSCISNT